ncbi:MAG: hypothetical protein KTR32_17070 [Granulosicoccus sp.]|nr:hypothetical protein [Granulosicoccus sp.]
MAAGRLIAYCEPHMYSWDCVAALLIISEAGGRHYPYQMDEMLSSGACIITAGEALYPQLQSLCLDAYQMQA